MGQGPSVLTVGAGGGSLDIFPLICHFSFLSTSLCETARYRLKYCLKEPLNPIQPTKSSAMHTTDRSVNFLLYTVHSRNTYFLYDIT